MLVFSKSLKQGHVYKYVEIWNALSTCKGNENLPSFSFRIKHLLHCRSLQLSGNVSVAYLMQTVLYRVMVMYYLRASLNLYSAFTELILMKENIEIFFGCFQQWQFMRESKCSRLICYCRIRCSGGKDPAHNWAGSVKQAQQKILCSLT